MMAKLAGFFTRSSIGRALVVAVLVASAAYATRLYYVDLPARQERDIGAEGAERLERMADAFEIAIEARGEGLAASLPARTQWYPAGLPCDAEVVFGPTDAGIWTILGVKPDEKTAFQYRFDYHDKRFTLRARRDSDCDGMFGVWSLEGRTDWTAVLGRSQSAQNFAE